MAGRLAQKLGVADLVGAHVTVAGEAGAHGAVKAMTVVGSALVGGDCIDDTNRLRAGASRRIFDGVRAPSTVGIWLRAFVWAAVRQLDRVTRELLARAWQAGLGPDLDTDLTVDIDSTVCETYGLAKQGATGFAYTGVRGYHPLVASLAETGELLHARLRGGTSASDRGAASFVAETILRVRHAGATGGLTLRADSGFYAGAVVSACRRHDVRFSITTRKNTAIRRAIDAIDDHEWVAIPYWIDGGAPSCCSRSSPNARNAPASRSRPTHRFSEWGQTFTDPRLAAAVVDRLTFNAHILETGTDSYRLRSTRTTKGATPTT